MTNRLRIPVYMCVLARHTSRQHSTTPTFHIRHLQISWLARYARQLATSGQPAAGPAVDMRTFHRPHPSLYDFVLALAPARYLIDVSRSPTKNTQASKQATNPCYNYELKVAGYSGNAGFDAFGYHNGMMFTTRDRDNDKHPTVNCAIVNGGGFWYNRCYRCGVNVYYGRASLWNFIWYQLPGGWELRLGTPYVVPM